VTAPVCLQLLPLDPDWLRRLAALRWPSHVLPAYTMDRQELFASLIRDHLFVSISRAGAESMASEHATRLARLDAGGRAQYSGAPGGNERRVPPEAATGHNRRTPRYRRGFRDLEAGRGGDLRHAKREDYFDPKNIQIRCFALNRNGRSGNSSSKGLLPVSGVTIPSFTITARLEDQHVHIGRCDIQFIHGHDGARHFISVTRGLP
jgi:hypothetical protein